MEDVETDVLRVDYRTDGNAGVLETDVAWTSPLHENSKPFMSEQTLITVHPSENSIRKIDFAITLKALVEGVEIGGSNDKKGYGGLCLRIKFT